MTKPKLDSTVTSDVGDVLALHADKLYRNLGSTIIIVAELKAVERVQPAPGEDKEQAVKLRVDSLEVGTGPHDEQVRRVQEALYRIRTKAGTFDEIAGLGAQQTLETAAGVIASTPPDRDDEDDDED